jgi:hypothetical protein
MKILALMTLVVLTLLPTAFASNVCADIGGDPDELSQTLKAQSLSRSPVKYFDAARRIEVITQTSNEALMTPYAVNLQGRNVVYLPVQFTTLLCNVVVAEYLGIEKDQANFFDRASGDAATCLNTGVTQSVCLLRFANELSIESQKAIAALPLKDQQTSRDQALAIYNGALHQIVMHEYAHLLLNHPKRLQAHQIQRADAEFEADIFAILDAIQIGEPSFAMHYFFGPIATIESRTTKLTTADYEPSACRDNNAMTIARSTGGILPMLLIDASFGGGIEFSRNSPDFIRKQGQAYLSTPPAPASGPCGKVGNVPLQATFDELRQLYSRMEPDLDLLFSLDQKEIENSTPRLARLAGDLAAISMRFRYMNGVSAKCLALMLRKWGLLGHDLTPLIGSSALFDASGVTDNFLSEDFGRLLQAQGLAILQERVDLTPPVRLDQANSYLLRAVAYNPSQTESWQNLAMIALKRGDCGSAAGFSERSIATFTNMNDKETLDAAKFFASKMKEMAADPKACAIAAANVHPYPNL